MKLSLELVDQAFRKHGSIYNDQKLWSIPYHIECWSRARLAFEGDSFPDFEWLYDELKGRWQALRNALTEPWSARKTFNHLRGLSDQLRGLTLREMNDADLPGCWRVLQSLSGLKPLKYGPSVVAISKFLHFWNPHLFVIVDDAVMWKWVFAHRWVRQPMLEVRGHVATLIDGSSEPVSTGACDLLSYLAILRWSADVVQQNSAVVECFARHVNRYAGGTSVDVPLERYDAAAMEWLLLGLVEIPPAGIAEASAD